MINLNDNVNLVGKWVIKYDEKYQMPQFVQGITIGNSSKHKNGQTIVINNIQYTDLGKKTVKTNDGIEYRLIGKGRRMILLQENDILELNYVDSKKVLKESKDE